MTEAASELHPSTPVVAALHASSRYINELKVAASRSTAAFTWLRHRQSRYVPLFDFDVICGALPRQVLNRQLAALNSGEGRTASIFSDYSGATTLRYLTQVLREFVVPPGTVAEIISQQQALGEKISSRAKQFIARIHAAIKDRSVLNEIMRGTGAVDLLLDDLTEIVQNNRDRNLLADVLERARPAGEFIEQDGDGKRALEVFDSSLKQLQQSRPDRSENNYHDAINAAFVARMFGEGGSHRPVPLLITQTRAVLDLQRNLNPRSLYDSQGSESVPLFGDKTFLIVSQGLLKMTEGIYATALDETKLLYQTSSQIADSCNVLIDYCNSMIAEGMPAQEITVGALPDAQWAMFLHHRQTFERRWGSIFSPMQSATQMDRHQYLQLLRAKDWGDSLRVKDREGFNRKLIQFTRSLEQAREPDHEIWSLILNRNRSTSENLTVRSSQLFDMVWRENDGLLLRAISATQPSQKPQSVDWAGTHDVQIAIVPNGIAAGAAFIVNSFCDLKISKRRYLNVTWRHSKAPAEIARACAKILEQTHGGSSANSVVANLYTSVGVITANDTSEEELERLAQRETAQTLQLILKHSQVFADIAPLEGVEAQIGVTLQDSMFIPEFVRNLSASMQETCEIPLELNYTVQILERCLAQLGARSPHSARLQ